MSQQKRNIDEAAEALDVPVDELTTWLMRGEYRPMPSPRPYNLIAACGGGVPRAIQYLDVHPHDLARWVDSRAELIDDLDASVASRTARDGFKREVVRDDAGLPLVILVHRPPSGGTTSTDALPAAALVSEDDYRGVAADLIARWADDHVDAATVLASLNLAAHGMPVTTPSRRALAKIRAYVAQIGGEDDARDVARHLTAILDEVGA